MVEEHLEIRGKLMYVSFDEMGRMSQIAHALSSPQRLLILEELRIHSLNINELSRKLDIPLSSVATHVNILEKAGLISTSVQAGVRGNVKICERRVDDIAFNLNNPSRKDAVHVQKLEVPVGSYSCANDIESGCGIIFSDRDWKYALDNPDVFLDPQHFQAQLLWFTKGHVEYRLPIPAGIEELDYLEISFEACSETYGNNNDWPSDIFVSVNDQRLGVWRCPGDFGGRRGRLNPDWWSDVRTQYGQLHTWRVDAQGSWLDRERISSTTLEQLQLKEQRYLKLCIGVYTDNGLVGGLNLFGRGFGDFPQDIELRYGWK